MDWAARLIGVFYVVAGAVALRQMAVSWRLEVVCGQYFPSSARDRTADVVLTIGSVLVFVSGVALICLHSLAVVAFLSCWSVQAGYLLWSQRWRPPETPVTATLRRQAVHGLAAYTVSTALVLGFHHINLLT
jgi:hypothetical protein